MTSAGYKVKLMQRTVKEEHSRIKYIQIKSISMK